MFGSSVVFAFVIALLVGVVVILYLTMRRMYGRWQTELLLYHRALEVLAHIDDTQKRYIELLESEVKQLKGEA